MFKRRRIVRVRHRAVEMFARPGGGAQDGGCAFELLETRQLLSVAIAQAVRSPFEVYPVLSPVVSTTTSNTTAAGDVPLSAVPALSSDPGAKATLYLDFTGDKTLSWQGYEPGITPAYDIDGDPTTFSQTELDNIRQIWARVAEKYSPFNINVTTVDPGNLTNLKTQEDVIGGDGAWYGHDGGVSYVGSFSDPTLTNKSFIFPANLGNGYPAYVGDAAAHEAGHSFGLQHQSVWIQGTKVSEYNSGDALKAPIMGDSYSAPRGLWWKGPSSLGENVIQDDMAVISGSKNGFGYRPDDHGNTPATADPLAARGSSLSDAGVITTTGDVDEFSFTASGNQQEWAVNVAPYGAMLHSTLKITDASGNVIASAATASLGQILTTHLAPGSYRLVVGSYGEYGDVGQYTVGGVEAHAGGSYTVTQGGTVTLDPGVVDPNLTYAWDLNGDGAFGQTGATATRGNETGASPVFHAPTAPGDYTVKLRVTDPATGFTSIDTAVVHVTAVSSGPLPSPWRQADAGFLWKAGSATSGANGAFTVTGSGSDINGQADAFHFVYQPVTGDGEIVARVASVGDTGPRAKAGIMIRGGTGAGNVYAGLLTGPGGGGGFYRRTTAPGETTRTSLPLSTPVWLKLVRSGNAVNAYRSTDGKTWTAAGYVTLPLGGTAYFGLAVSSGTNGALDTATFTDVAVAPSVTIDNTAATLTGTWTTTPASSGIVGATYLTDAGATKGLDSAKYAFVPPAPLRYAVYADWIAGADRATNASYAIDTGGGKIMSVSENQRVSGGRWILLGTYDFSGAPASVTIRDGGADGIVVADGIGFVPV